MSQKVETQEPSSPTGCHLIYDHECRLCVSIKNRLAKTADTTDVKFVPYESPEARALLGTAYTPGRPHVAYLIDAEGKRHQGLDAFIPLLPGLQWGRWVLPLWRFSWFRACGYALYRFIARHRYAWFGEAK